MTEPVYTVRDAYGKPFSELTPPEGWEFTGEFRVPLSHEDWLSSYEPKITSRVQTFPTLWCPRLILRQIKRKRIIFEEIARRHEAEHNEWVSRSETKSDPWQVCGHYRDVKILIIFSRREEEF